MTALDQAFIKAYVHRLDPGTLAGPAEQADGRDVPRPHISGRSFRPMLQVEHFTWPKVCSQLGGAAAGELDRLSDGLLAATAEGRRVLALGGCRRGEGTTTLVLCAGRRLAERGLKVVMVDANLADPQLARQLRLTTESGWEEVLAGRLPLEEVVIESAHNFLALLPLLGPFAGTDKPPEDETRLADSMATLSAHYDLTLVDLEPLEDSAVLTGSPARALARCLDAVVMVHNVRATPQNQLVDVQRRLAEANIEQVGIVENFVVKH